MIEFRNYIEKPERVRAFVFHERNIQSILNSNLFVDVVGPDEDGSYMLCYAGKPDYNGESIVHILYCVNEGDFVYQYLDDDGTRGERDSTRPEDFYDIYMWDAVNN